MNMSEEDSIASAWIITKENKEEIQKRERNTGRRN